MEPVLLYVPWLGTSTNQSNGRKHWSQRHKEVKAGVTATRLAAFDARLKLLDEQVDLTFIPQLGKGVRRLDCSNYASTAKIIEDGLVRAGVLPGDEPWHVGSVTLAEPIREKSRPSGCWVIIRPATRATEAMAMLREAKAA